MNLIDPIHRHAARWPDRLAVITPQHKVSWSQLDGLIWSTALQLHRQGLAEGDRVGVTMRHPLVHLICTLALARLGVAHLALPLTEGQDRRMALQRDLALKAVVCDADDLAEGAVPAIVLRQLEPAAIDSRQRAAIASGNDVPWFILQSSGTTGLPKFSELTHHAAIRRCEEFSGFLSVAPDDVVWVQSRLDFFMAKYALLRALRGGGTVCLPVGMTMSAELVDFLNAHRVTLGAGIPSVAALLVAIGKPLPTLRGFAVTSAPVPERLRSEFREKVNPNLYVVYGTNETGSVTLAPPDAQDVEGSVGKPEPAAAVEIVDAAGVAVPAGTPGEIRLRAPGAIRCYLNAPEATAECFRDGWFHPGDLGLLTPSGELVFLGRKDDMIVFDGMNIHPAEIERALASHPAVLEAAAFPLAHERFHQVPVAAVTLRRPTGVAELVEHCKATLGIKHPRKVFLIEEFPRNPMGKILKRQLAQTLGGAARA